MFLRLLSILILSIIIVFSFRITLAEELIQAPAAIHISSKISDGIYTIPKIVAIAKENNIKVIIMTDRDLMRWEYGLWPLRRIIKKTVETGSVFIYGVKNYLREIEEVQRSNPDLVLIPGVESAPFYYWEGSPFRNLKMCNWHKHMLVIGLDKVKDYKMLPSFANRYSLKLPYKLKDIYRLWPILLLIIGILCLRKRKFRYKDLQGRPLGPYSRGWRIFGICIIIFSPLFLINNFPFRSFKYDQYHGEQGIGPYQNFIDYVKQHGGLTFWAHPEAEYIQRFGRIKIETRNHASDLMEAYDYTGFAIFYEGYNKVGCPYGLWDEVLKEYCQGIREKPIWAIGGLSFDSLGNLSDYMKDLRNILLVPKLSRVEALKALREGRMYVIKGRRSYEFILDKFVIRENSTDVGKTMGQQITLQGNPKLEISGHFTNGENLPFKIKLIKNGKIIEIFEVTSPFDIAYQDEYNHKDRMIYYRIEAESDGINLITNPIFVSRK